jgi:PKD domain
MAVRRRALRGYSPLFALAVICPVALGGAAAFAAPDAGQPAVVDSPAAVVVAITAPTPAGNLTANPSFETSTRGWASWQGNLSRVAVADAPDGEFVSRVDRRAGSAFTIDDVPDSVAPSVVGTVYVARAFVRAAEPSSVGKRMRLTVREWSDSQLARTSTGTSVRLTESFQPITVATIAKVPASTIDVHATQLGAESGDAFLIDQISIVGDRAGGAPGNQGPRASFTVTPSNPAPDQEVVFTDTSTDADGVIASTLWDLNGDGVFDDATGPQVTRSFPAPGAYTIGVRVLDNNGARAASRRVVSVAPAVVVETPAPEPGPPATG